MHWFGTSHVVLSLCVDGGCIDPPVGVRTRVASLWTRKGGVDGLLFTTITLHAYAKRHIPQLPIDRELTHL